MIGLLMLAQISAGAQVIPIVTRADPVPGGRSLTELRFVQSAVHAAASRGPWRLHAMLSLEGLTMPGGHLTPGAWGEGFIDRRHPHTYVHELVASAVDPVRLPFRWSLSAGKGFAPFGTDDPMSRPPVAFPVNHHWSQVLERAVAIFAAGAGPVIVEAGLFNGDEPEKPSQWPALERFGDSWSVRGFLTVGDFELQVSRAQVESPEHRQGAGLDHAMTSAALRHRHPLGNNHIDALVEWSRTDEEGAFQFSSMLAEAELVAGSLRPYLRIERTERPEEERVLGDDFRGRRPHNENSNLGTTRWAIVTAGVGRRFGALGPVQLETITEVSLAHVTSVTGVVIVPDQFYGRNDIWSLSVGLRIGAGAPLPRMGRYGLAAVGSAGHINEQAH